MVSRSAGRPVAAGTCGGRGGRGDPRGRPRRSTHVRDVPGVAGCRAGSRVDTGGQLGDRRFPPFVGDGRLAARLAARRAGPARRPGSGPRPRIDGRGHDRRRDSPLRRGHHRRPLGVPGGVPGRRRPAGKRCRVRGRLAGAPGRHRKACRRHRDRAAAPVPAPARAGETGSAAGDGACRVIVCGRRRRRAYPRQRPRAARQGGVHGASRGGRGAVRPGRRS